MDAATAAAMSDPERNPAFRRRWQEAPGETSDAPGRSMSRRMPGAGRPRVARGVAPRTGAATGGAR